MKDTWLIQRLQKPIVIKNEKMEVLQGFSECLSFGGGLRNGGLTKEAMNLLRPIFSFDYMGSSEFEWGVVPQSLSSIVKNIDKYISFTMSVEMENVKENIWRKYAKKGEKIPEKQTGIKDIYILCIKEDKEEVKKIIRDLAMDKINLKERCMLDTSLDPITDSDKRNCGWLELDNNFMFFIDQDMFEKTVKLFTGKQ